MNYASLCAGIEAASVAWHDLGWQPAFFSEIAQIPRAILGYRFPDVPLLGDFTKIKAAEHEAVKLVVAGTPCQDFSVAGLRAGIAGDRGGLTLAFVDFLERFRPRWFLWENVPGILSNDEGRAFGIFLARLAECGYGFAYRILNAEYFGVPQRRRRIFVVGYYGDWRPPAAVLFERESVSWNLAPSRGPREDFTGTIDEGAAKRGGYEPEAIVMPDIAGCLQERDAKGADSDTKPGHLIPVIPILEAGSRTGKSTTDLRAGAGIGEPGDPMFTIQSRNRHAIAFDCKASGSQGFGTGDIAPTLRSMEGERLNGGGQVAVAFESRVARNGRGAPSEVVPPLKAQSGKTGKGDSAPLTMQGMKVRRLTPRECERLQGFPDDWTLVPLSLKARQTRVRWTSDAGRYKAIGNSMAVPVMRWLGQRIDLIDKMIG